MITESGDLTMSQYNELKKEIETLRTENQAIKAIAIARGYLAISGKDIVCIPAFSDVFINGMERTALRFVVESTDLGYAI